MPPRLPLPAYRGVMTGDYERHLERAPWHVCLHFLDSVRGTAGEGDLPKLLAVVDRKSLLRYIKDLVFVHD